MLKLTPFSTDKVGICGFAKPTIAKPNIPIIKMNGKCFLRKFFFIIDFFTIFNELNFKIESFFSELYFEYKKYNPGIIKSKNNA